jgi:hypothetical protein
LGKDGLGSHLRDLLTEDDLAGQLHEGGLNVQLVEGQRSQRRLRPAHRDCFRVEVSLNRGVKRKLVGV